MLLEDAVKLNGVEPVGPSYTVYRYTDQIYKIVHFHSTKPRVGPVTKRGEARKTDGPPDLHSSLSRARRTILELALCNHWDYFCTFTLDPKYDRYDLKNGMNLFMTLLNTTVKSMGYRFGTCLYRKLTRMVRGISMGLLKVLLLLSVFVIGLLLVKCYPDIWSNITSTVGRITKSVLDLIPLDLSEIPWPAGST